MKLKVIIAAAIIIFLSLNVAYANDNLTDQQTDIINAENNQIIINVSGNTFNDIQNAINDASENGTIDLEGIYISKGKAITITKPITITSKNGATLDGKSKSNILNISNVTVCINNVHFINSKSTDYAAIENQGNLTLINSKFINNTVYDPNGGSDFEMEYSFETAGAIYSTNDLKIIGCEFKDNYAAKLVMHYEYFYNYLADYGGAINSKGTLIISNSRFYEDYIDSHGRLNVSSCEFTSCNINCYNISSITDSIFTKKESTVLYVESDINITNCNFTENGGCVIYLEEFDQPCKVIIDNCSFINNNLKSSGYYDYSDEEYAFNEESDTIYSYGADTYIYNSNFVNNTDTINSYGQLYVLNSSFSKNTRHRGGAINADNATIINSTFNDNTAKSAGAIYANVLFMENCNFTNNNEGTIEIAKSAVINNITYAGHQYLGKSLNKIELIRESVGTLKTTYKSGKTLMAQFIYTESKHPLASTTIDIEIYKNGKLFDSGYVWTDSKGKAYFEASDLKVGKYTIIFDDSDLPKLKTTVTITKAKTTVKAQKVTNKFKKSKYFKVTVKNKATKKAVKYLKIKVKVYTGKKYKTYTIKTDRKGVAKLNTKTLKLGKHRVTLTSANTNYQLSAKSTIIIKK